jgi:surface protein
MRPFFENNVLQQQPFKPMIIVVDTTKAGSASNTFVLPIIKATTETVKIYWGDGTNSTGVNGNNTHVYAASGIYTVKIESKIFGGIYFNNLGDKDKITKIANYGQGVSRLNIGSFYGCSSLLSIDIGNIVSNGADASNQYRGCTALTTVPLFNLSSVTNAYAMFYQCTTLTTVPLFNLSNCTNASFMFASCASLTTVPLLNLSSVTNASYMFYLCTSLTTVPLFDLSKVTDASYMFYQCTPLTTVPLLNLSNCTDTRSMFRNCTSLTTVPLFDLSKVTNATSMFLGVTLTTTSYSDFLINLATLPLRSGVAFSGGNSKYNPAAATARADLISNFGWTITDGGAA